MQPEAFVRLNERKETTTELLDPMAGDSSSLGMLWSLAGMKTSPRLCFLAGTLIRDSSRSSSRLEPRLILSETGLMNEKRGSRVTGVRTPPRALLLASCLAAGYLDAFFADAANYLSAFFV